MQSIRCQARILFSTATSTGRSIRLNLLRNVGTGTGAGPGTGIGTPGSRSRSELMRKLREWHATAFSNRFLLFTNVGISLTLSCLGDVLEQHLEIYSGEIERFDSQRTSHMAISGVTVGIICHYWYKMLDKRMPGRSMRVVAKKIVLDQLICSPVYISVFFVTLGLLEQKDKHEVWEEIKEKAWKLYAAEWTVWPAAQFINFYWIPAHYRIFYDNIISLGYDVLTSKVKHTKSHIKKIP
ncbi:mpv17-like protein 2 isoform X1 [Drosophila subobscura]|uniref:mpv17-like protein 2 isoform X1 n=1 Tax=Drosophila subobscura TaxID=7241 RepID=UPI00155AB8B8|nr:mpv17-like protein 2 isoform X1 [Drosophila subobscura]